ncbi:MAG: magnesium transporter [Nocardiaceae bacterium]|nr:magnesium transporter [Nocardiaceae bacterium]
MSEKDEDVAVGTAAAHATADVPVASPDEPVDEFIERIRGRRFTCASVAAVCRGDTLVGLITMERLLNASPGALAKDVMDSDPPTVIAHHAQEIAVWKALQHDEPGLAVVDDAGKFVGLVPPQRLLTVLLEEHDQDIARISGYLASAAGARTASEEPVPLRLWHRLPWLLVGTIGAMIAAVVIDAFQAQLERQVLIAFFIPGIVYLADAVGTQTEALVIRGLSVGVTVRRVAFREWITGLVIGALIALVLYPATVIIWGNAEVALSVAIAVFAACAIATLVAMGLPWIFSLANIDPAYGSGPLATVIQDILSIFVYLLVASAVVGI